MRSKKINAIQLGISMMILTILVLLVLAFQAEADPEGEFVSGNTKNAESGDSVTMQVTVRNSGDEASDFYVDDPALPDGWDFEWVDDNPQTIHPDSSEQFAIRIDISDDNLEARAGTYEFEMSGEFDTDSGSQPIEGECYLTIHVQQVYGVDLDTEDPQDNGEPGDSITFRVTIENTGNGNDTYELSLLNEIRDWAHLEGVDDGDTVTLEPGEEAYFDVVVDIPEFTEENDEAEAGYYDLTLEAVSENENDAEDTQDFEVEVEEFFRVSLWCDFPTKEEMLQENQDLEISYEISVKNLGNAQDDILLEVPQDEFSGDKSDWHAKFGSSNEKTVSLDPLAQTSVTMDLFIDKDTDEGDYSIRVRGQSESDTSVYTYVEIFQNLTKASYQVGLDKITQNVPEVNPNDGAELEFRFYLKNEGDVEDRFTVEVITPLNSGTYKNWTIEFENKEGERVDQMSVPGDVPGYGDDHLDNGDKVEIYLYVIVDRYEDAGSYPDIVISGQSDNDQSQIEYLDFNLTVIRSNIQITNDPLEFNIEPDENIMEGDTIDINLKIYNTGTAETGPFYVWFYNGLINSPLEEEGEYIALHRIDNIPAKTDTEIFVSWEVPGGENDIFAYADKPIRSGDRKTWYGDAFCPEGDIIESMEDDNYASIAPEFKASLDIRPDIVLQDIEITDNTTGTENVVVRVTLYNEGSVPAVAGTVTVRVEIDGVSLTENVQTRDETIISECFDPYETIFLEFLWDVPDVVGKFIVNASCIQPNDRDPSNNNLSMMVQTWSPGTDPSVDDPTGPDLYISSDDITSTEDHRMGQNMTFMVVIHNKGDTTARATLKLLLDGIEGETIGSINVEVPYSGTIIVNITGLLNKSGTIDLYLAIEDVKPQDTDDTNNGVAFTIEVKEGKDPGEEEDGEGFIPLPIWIVILAFMISSMMMSKNNVKHN